MKLYGANINNETNKNGHDNLQIHTFISLHLEPNKQLMLIYVSVSLPKNHEHSEL